MEIEIETYRSSNLNEIAILLAKGKKFIRAEKEPNSNRVCILFETDDCQSIITSYYNKESLVSPFDFAESLKAAKDIIFNFERR